MPLHHITAGIKQQANQSLCSKRPFWSLKVFHHCGALINNDGINHKMESAHTVTCAQAPLMLLGSGWELFTLLGDLLDL